MNEMRVLNQFVWMMFLTAFIPDIDSHISRLHFQMKTFIFTGIVLSVIFCFTFFHFQSFQE